LKNDASCDHSLVAGTYKYPRLPLLPDFPSSSHIIFDQQSSTINNFITFDQHHINPSTSSPTKTKWRAPSKQPVSFVFHFLTFACVFLKIATVARRHDAS
jgi:hypothetical protein